LPRQSGQVSGSRKTIGGNRGIQKTGRGVSSRTTPKSAPTPAPSIGVEARKQRDLGRVQVKLCWNCRPVHRELKEVSFVIYCLLCANWFYRGENVSLLMKKS